MSSSLGRIRILGLLIMIVGALMVIGGIITWFAISSQLSDEKIKVSADASMFAGDDVNGPFTAYVEANTIEKHTLDITGGKTYAELAKDDPKRQTAMTGSFLRASLFTSVVAFGLAFTAFWVGLVLLAIGWALRALGAPATGPPAAA